MYQGLEMWHVLSPYCCCCSCGGQTHCCCGGHVFSMLVCCCFCGVVMVNGGGGWWMVDGGGACNKTVSSNSNEINKNEEKHTWGLRRVVSWAPCCWVGHVVVVVGMSRSRLVMMVVVMKVWWWWWWWWWQKWCAVTWHFYHASLLSFAILTNPDYSHFRPLTPNPDLNICGLRRIFCSVPHSCNVRQLLLLVPSHHLCRYL